MLHAANHWRNQNYGAFAHAEDSLQPFVSGSSKTSSTNYFPYIHQSAVTSNMCLDAEIDRLSCQVDDRLKPSLSKLILIDENYIQVSCAPPSTTTPKVNSGASNDGCSSQTKDYLKPPLPELIPLARNLTERSCTPPPSATPTNISLMPPSSQMEDYLKVPLPGWISMTKNSTDLLSTPTSAPVANIITSKAEVDDKKWKRRISNRESARRSRIKREKHMKDLIDEKSMLERNLHENKHKVVVLSERRCMVELENKILRDETVKLREYLNYLDKITASSKENDNNFNEPIMDHVYSNCKDTLSTLHSNT